MEDLIHEKIYLNPQVHLEKPCIKNTRIPVYSILELVRDGINFDDIVKSYYPDITREDIKACIEYAVLLVRDEEIHLSNK
jgi:uncharacterized protein (DUF433 family)